MKVKPGIVFGVVVILFLSSLPAIYSQVAGVVRGTVTDAQGEAIQGVEITIMGLDIRRTYKAKTNRNGEYLHAGVPLQGTYRVVARKEGFQSDFVEGIRPGSSSSDERGRVDFRLNPGAAGVMSFELTDEQRAQLEEDREAAEARAAANEAARASFDEGIQLYNAGNYQDALASFETAAEASPEEPVVWANLANTHFQLKQNDEAIEAYSRAIELDPETPAYYQNRGSVYAEKGDIEKAKADYDKAASLSATLNPEEAAISYYNMGVTYINSGKLDEALEALRKALELNPSYGEAQYQLGITLLGSDLEAAKAELRKYLEISPSGSHAAEVQAILEQLGD